MVDVRLPGDDQVRSYILFDAIHWHAKVNTYAMGVKSNHETHQLRRLQKRREPITKMPITWIEVLTEVDGA
jgi:hypothetical protein